MSEPHTERDLKLVDLLDQALSELRAGKPVETVTWQGQHPDLAEDLPALLETMRDLDTAAASWKGAATVGEFPTRPGHAPACDEGAVPASVGRYRVLGLLGAGGMGKVYQAHDPQLDRAVAIKVPRIDGGARTARVARFLREARAAARVRHPHVCPIHDVGEDGGLPYVVMAYVEGESLAQRLERLGRYEDPRDAVALVRQVAAALQAVHDEGIVHRDLKPGNILLDTSGAAFLSDFGLARSGEAGEALTIDGDLLGTPAYMAPEQAQGRSDRVGPRADLYSLGVVLYQMLTGRLPHEGPTMLGLLHRISTEEAPPPSRFRPDLHPALAAVVSKAMARQPEDRHASPKDFAAALGAWLQGVTPTVSLTAAPAPAVAPAAPEMKTVELSGLPGGETLKLSLPAGSKADVKVRMTGGERGKRRRKASWAVTVSISVAVAALLLAVALPFYFDAPVAQLPGPVAQADASRSKDPPPGGGDRDAALSKGGEKFDGDKGGVEKGVRDKKPGGPITLGKDGPVVLASAANLRPRQPQPSAQEVQAVSWSLDGKQVASATTDGTVTVLDAQTGKEVKRLRGQEAAVYFLQTGGAYTVTARGAGERDELFVKAQALAEDSARLYLGGEAEAAAPLLRQAVELTRNAYPKAQPRQGDPDLARYLNYFGAALKSQGKLDDARRCHERALAIQKKALGEVHPEVATTLSHLGLVLQTQGKPAEAISYLQQALAIRRKALPADHPDLAAGLNNLGTALRAQGKLDEARVCYEHALAIHKKMLGTEHPHLATSHHNLGSVLRAQGRLDEARAHLEKALAIRKKMLPADHPDLAQSLTNLEVALWDQGKRDTACVAYSPAGNNLAAVLPKKIEIRDLESGKSFGWATDDQVAMTVAAFSPDGKRLVAGGERGAVKVWDVAARKQVASPQGHAARVRAVVFSPDGKFLASAGDDCKVKLWDAATGKSLSATGELPASVLSLAFSPDGRLLACGDSEGVVRVWTRLPWRLIARTATPKDGTPEPVPALAFSPDGSRLVTAGADGSATVWSHPVLLGD